MAGALFARGKMGIDGNLPIDLQSGAIAGQLANPVTAADTGAAFVRLNFVLGPWSSPHDNTLRAGRTWFQTYDALVDGLLARGVGIYGLIGAEATSRPDMGDCFRNPAPNGDADNWLQEYLANFRSIVAHYASRIKLFESFNEPNDWHGGTSSWLHPYWFSKLLRQVYQHIKIDAGYKVTLVSGPLLSHDLPGGGDDGSYYLDQTYRQGRAHHAWESFQTNHGTYPLDDIGYHLYVAERRDINTSDIEETYNRHLGAISKVIRRYEGDLTGKGIHLSEYGWASNHGEDWQARNMSAGFRLLRDRLLVKTATWFCLQDFPGHTYGLYRQGSLTAGNRKQAYETFRALIAEGGPRTQVGYDATGRRYQAIITAYERMGGLSVLGVPFDNGRGEPVYRWGAGVAQDLKTGSGQASIILLKDGASSAYVLRGVIRHRYIYTYGGPQGPLGFPVSDQNEDEWKLPRCTFEGGLIACRTYGEFFD